MILDKDILNITFMDKIVFRKSFFLENFAESVHDKIVLDKFSCRNVFLIILILDIINMLHSFA